MLSRWPTNPFGTVPSVPITIGTAVVLTFLLNFLARSSLSPLIPPLHPLVQLNKVFCVPADDQSVC